MQIFISPRSFPSILLLPLDLLLPVNKSTRPSRIYILFSFRLLSSHVLIHCSYPFSLLPPLPITRLPPSLPSHRPLTPPKFYFLHSTFHHLLPPLHNLRTHIHQPPFRLAVREIRNGLNGFIDVFLSEGAGLLEARASEDDFTRLWVGMLVFDFFFGFKKEKRERNSEKMILKKKKENSPSAHPPHL